MRSDLSSRGFPWQQTWCTWFQPSLTIFFMHFGRKSLAEHKSVTISSGLGKTSFVRGVAEAQPLIQLKIEYNLTRVPGVIFPGIFLPLDDKEDTLGYSLPHNKVSDWNSSPYYTLQIQQIDYHGRHVIDLEKSLKKMLWKPSVSLREKRNDIDIPIVDSVVLSIKILL